MAQAGGAAGGGAGGGGAGAGEEDVPDVRFFYNTKMDVGNHSKSWLDGNYNSPLCKDIPLDDKEALLISVLKNYNVADDELNIQYRVSDEVRRRQPAYIMEHVDNGLVLSRALGRKRRLALFLMILFRQSGSKSYMSKVPPQYRNPAQLKGDIASLKEQCNTLLEELMALRALARNVLQIPAVFKVPVDFPNAK